jgi:predicted RecA/RadA family phage recombinase
MQNKVNQGLTIKYTNTAAETVKGGTPVVVGSVVGIAVVDIPQNETQVLEAEGVFELEKANVAVTQGAKVYLAAGKITTATVTGEIPNPYVGVAWLAAAAADPYIWVKINVG